MPLDPRRLLVLALGLVSVGLLAACTAKAPGDLGGSPVGRALYWRSYLDGDDLRASCRAGASDRARLVYNARYIDQVRAYDLTVGAARARLQGQVFSGTGLVDMRQGDGLGLSKARPFERALTASEAETVWAALADAGAFDPAPRTTLQGHEVWWLAVGCRNGARFFNAWRAGTPAWAGQRFRDVLAPLDASGIAFSPVERQGPPIETDDTMRRFDFRLEVVPGGLLYR